MRTEGFAAEARRQASSVVGADESADAGLHRRHLNAAGREVNRGEGCWMHR
ncbi:hypothetical protein [[Mycobacterium] nativiensis]|uniref:Uncharacterized protein n=1 Tax=[Mycobacterium] nativiensis TaxID=2855503 RepID=A0ABU5XSB5_9MYCO|nr:hypothetical protein [Mycolicibacter sp. MYC340]MEB3030642.1 hypothetical protein [Mycolicibacter sp. MYC340]